MSKNTFVSLIAVSFFFLSVTQCFSYETFTSADQYIEEALRVGQTRAHREEMVYYLYKAIELDPGSYRAYTYLGAAFVGKKQYENALKFFEQAIICNPNYQDIYVYRGFAYFDLEQIDNAIADFTRALEIGANFQAYSGLGSCYLLKQKFSEAVDAFTKAIEMVELSANKTDKELLPYFYSSRAEAYLELKEYDKCRADVEELEKLGGAFPPDKLARLKDRTAEKGADPALGEY